MKKNVVLLFLFLYSFLSFSQEIKIIGNDRYSIPKDRIDKNSIDSTVFRCQYRQRIALSIDTIQNKSTGYQNIMLLQIGKKVSKYYDYKIFVADSIFSIDQTDESLNYESFANKQLALRREAERRSIYKNYPEGKITNTEYLAFQNNKFEEELKSPKWNITSDTLTVLGYVCNKATCRFQGRNYIAWYAPEIPISNGPWKFTGLPGLILKVSDDKKEIFFDCISLEKVDWNERITMPKSTYTKTTLSKFLKMKLDFMDNPAAFVAGHELAPKDLSPATSQKHPYNPIELEVE